MIILTKSSLFSQNESVSGNQKRGSFSAEFSLGKTHPADKFQFQNLLLKYTFKNAVSIRLGLHAEYIMNAITDDDYETTETKNSIYYESSFTYGISPGLQLAVIKLPKFNSYIGIDLSFLDKFTEAKYIEYSDNDEIRMVNTVTGSWREKINTEYYYYYDFDKERGFQSLGGKLVFGSEFYPLEKLYIGFEFAYGYERKTFDAIHSSMSVSQFDNVTNDETVYPSLKTYYTGFYSNNMIRIGIRF